MQPVSSVRHRTAKSRLMLVQTLYILLIASIILDLFLFITSFI